MSLHFLAILSEATAQSEVGYCERKMKRRGIYSHTSFEA
jgi:hypothetical protein